MMEMRRVGLIGGIGLSNVTLDEFHGARAQAEVACVQNAFNLSRSIGSRPLRRLPCRRGALRAVLSSWLGLQSGQPGASRAGSPRDRSPPSGDAGSGGSAGLVTRCIRSPTVLLIPGTSSLRHLEENLAAADLSLDQEALAVLP